MNITFNLNGKPVCYAGTGTERLLDVLREGFELTGTKCGCKEGECGACAVILDGRLVNSCLVPTGSLEGRNVVTIEGFSEMPMFKEISEGFQEVSAVQCGYCIPGMVLASATLLEQNADPDEEDIRTALSGNLCRCTGYNAIVKGVGIAADKLGRDRTPREVFPRGNKREEFIFPRTLEQALSLRDQTELKPCGGATDLLVGEPDPGSFFFLGGIPELRKITTEDGWLRIGSEVTFTEMLESPQTPQILKDAVSGIAAPAIRNMGTIGGNIGNGTAKADTSLIMFALNAMVELSSVDGTRLIPVSEFYRGKNDLAIEDNELITALLIPDEDIGRYMYEKVGGRRALAISRISFAGILKQEDGIVTDMRAAFGAVAPTVLRLPEIEKKLVGRPVSEARDMIPEILDDYSEAMQFTRGRVSAEYRKDVCMNLLGEFLRTRLAA